MEKISKKNRYENIEETLKKIRKEGLSYTVEEVCLEYGVSRQSYYQQKKRVVEDKYQEEIIIQMVMEIRKRQPKIGGRKLHWMLKKDLEKLNYKVGRDKFFEILRENSLLIHRKRRYAKTTNSKHRFMVYNNLIKNLEVERINQVFVGDITYLRTEGGFVYLALLTDLYSRKIVGYSVSESLSTEISITALKMALKGVEEPEKLIHHSDRGFQYCSGKYTEILNRKEIKISMGEKGNPYENAVAERVNGILKDEFLLDQTFRTIREAKIAVKESIKIYNEERPHMSIEYMTPSEKYKTKKAA